MPRAGYTHVLIDTVADAYQRITSGGADTTVTLHKNCVAVILAAETATVFVQFDDSAASATNGLPIISGAQPIYIPLGRLANSNATLRVFSATGVLSILQLA